MIPIAARVRQLAQLDSRPRHPAGGLFYALPRAFHLDSILSRVTKLAQLDFTPRLILVILVIQLDLVISVILVILVILLIGQLWIPRGMWDNLKRRRES